MTEETVKPDRPVLITRESLLATRPRKTKLVPVPELGGSVIVRQLSAKERGELEAYFAGGGDEKTRIRRLSRARERLVLETVVDEQGNKLLTPGDLVVLAEQPGTILERICKEAQELNEITESDLEDLAGN